MNIEEGKQKKQLLGESFTLVRYDIDNLKELIANDLPIFLEAKIQCKDTPNNNRRIYSGNILDREMKTYQIMIDENRALAETDHPMERDVVYYQMASHRLTKWWWSGNDLMGRIEILPGKFFPMANILRGCLITQIPIGFSSRGLGSEIKLGNGLYQVGDDFTLSCFDAVPNPSTRGAFAQKLTESAEAISRNENISQILRNKINKSIEQIIINGKSSR